MKEIKNITVVGAGLVGSLVSIFLAKRGYQVTLFERRPDLRKSSISAGKSINLALSNRGWLPLAQVGLENQLLDMVVPMHGRIMHDVESNLTFQPYGKEGEYINSISRGGLNALLMTTAEENGVKIYFDCLCTQINHETAHINFVQNGDDRDFKADLIIGSDGAFSAVRSHLQKNDRFNYSQHYVPHGYKELSISAKPDGGFKIEENALHIWPRGEYMLIALPNKDGSFTVTLFLPFDGDKSFKSLNSVVAVRDFFGETFPDALPIINQLDEDFFTNPTSSLVTVKCDPWVHGKSLLIGDAAHAIVPFYGQGMNCGFEDCRVLNDLLDEYGDDWGKVLPKFQESRKVDADAIADLALQNFVEMRDKVSSPRFLTRKKIEAKLHDLFPDKWIPQYSMVTFNEDIRYSEALAVGQRQKEIMDSVMQQHDILENWDSLELSSIIEKL